MNDSFETATILRWFTGKSLEKATAALKLLDQSVKQGFWVKGASRSVRAALGKTNVAAKLANANQVWLERLGVPDGKGTYDSEYAATRQLGWNIYMSLAYGNFEQLVQLDLAAALNALGPAFPAPSTLLPLQRQHRTEVLSQVAEYQKAFAPVAAAVAELDEARPPPVFTSIGVSPTLTATLTDLGFIGDLKVSVCPIRWEKRETTDKDGKKHTFFIGILLWPEGTVHGASRYRGTDIHEQCEACGHAIKRIFNWVPLVLEGAGQPPKSLWVGRDCAKSIFGVKMDGDLDIEETQE
jgi:hypothetical protein